MTGQKMEAQLVAPREEKKEIQKVNLKGKHLVREMEHTTEPKKDAN